MEGPGRRPTGKIYRRHTVLDESGKTSVENQGNTFWKFSAKEEGMYQFRFNVPISSTEIHTEQGEIINLSRDAINSTFNI